MNIYSLIISLIIATALSATGAVTDGRMGGKEMMKDGRSLVTIVLPDSAGKYTRLASDDLGRCLSKVLDAQVSTVEALSQVETPFTILLGDDFSVDFNAPVDGLQRDGYVIKTCGCLMMISGWNDNGIANGIYSFLMDYVGVRWFAPGDMFEFVPVNPQLAWPELDVRQNPDFVARVVSGVTSPDGEKWLRRNRFDIDVADLPYSRVSHNLEVILPPSIYGEDHPEYYPMIDGVRRVPSQDRDSGIQPCYTNPDVIEIIARSAADYFSDNPTATTYPLGINDNMEFCRCPKCAELDSPQRMARGGWLIYSDSYFYMVTEVAKRVAKTNPGKYLSCYAYWGVELPPRHIKELPGNVVVALTQDTSQHFDSEYKKADRELWLAWSKVAKHLIKYDYYGLGWLTPRHYPTLIADDLKFVAANRAVAFRCESYPNWPINAPQMYLASRLLWKTSIDSDAVLDEYFSLLYGAAAPDMKHFNTLMERYWTQPRKGKWFQGLEDIAAEMAMADDALIEEAMQSLRNARSKVTGTEGQRLLQYISDLFDFTYAIVKGSCLHRELRTSLANGVESSSQIDGRIHKLLDMIRLAEDTYSTKWRTDPLYNTKYYAGYKFDSKFNTWVRELQTSIEMARSKME